MNQKSGASPNKGSSSSKKNKNGKGIVTTTKNNKNDKIEAISQKIMANKSHSNSIVDLLKFAQSPSNTKVQLKAIKNLTKIFTHYLIDKKHVRLLANDAELQQYTDSKKLNATEKYRLWFTQRYNDFKELLVDHLSSSGNGGACGSEMTEKESGFLIQASFDLVKLDARLATTNANESSTSSSSSSSVPLEFFHSILVALWRNEELSEKDDARIKKLVRSYLSVYSDLRYFSLRYLLNTFYPESTGAGAKSITSSIFMNLLNTFSLMSGLEKASPSAFTPPPPAESAESQALPTSDEKSINLEEEEMLMNDGNELAGGKEKKNKLFVLKAATLVADSKICDQDVHRKLFNDAFVALLRKHQMNARLYKKVLVKLPERILPKMSNPLMMADFLTQSYNMGGLIGVLALNGLFILMNNYNLEYPNFYKQVYKMLDAAIYATKYKDRFFQLLDMFLMSTHLSSQLVAAFIKKLSRMSLTCPPGDLRFQVLFIFNLLIRHRNCKILVHNAKVTRVTNDPYDVNALDYNECGALRSSLWEVRSLRDHYMHNVSKQVVEKLATLSDREYKLDDAFESNSYEDMIDEEMDENSAAAANCAVNFELATQSSRTFKKSGTSNNAAIKYDASVSNLLTF